MDDTVTVQVLEGINDLHGVTLDFQLMESLASLKQFIQTLVLTKLEKYVNAFRVLKEVHELAHIRMLHRTMDLDLRHQLLLGSASLKRGLVDDLGSTDTLRFALNELIALGEATFAEEFTFDVLAVGDFSILVLYSLLDDLSIGTRITTCRVKVCLTATGGGSS